MRWPDRLAGVIGALLLLAVLVPMGLMLWSLLEQGAGVISVDFLLDDPRQAGRAGGIAALLVSTGWILAVCLLVAAPMGLGCALYLSEQVPAGTRRAQWLGGTLDMLAAVPSIVYGLFGYQFFAISLGLGFSILSGGLALALMVLPLMIRSAEQALRAVPFSYRQARGPVDQPLGLGQAHPDTPGGAGDCGGDYSQHWPGAGGNRGAAVHRRLCAATAGFAAGFRPCLECAYLRSGHECAWRHAPGSGHRPGAGGHSGHTESAGAALAAPGPRSLAMTSLTLELQQVSVYYGNQAAIEQASLSVRAGELMALVGPSGCGKSSLLASINRMTDGIPGCRVSGTVLLGGDALSASQDAATLRRRIGMVFQQPNPFPLSIIDNLRFPLAEHGVPRRERDRRAEQVLRAVGLWEEVKGRLSQSALGLSGGQQQRLCIARALVLEPQVLLLDEPCSALDPVSSKVVEELIVSLKGRYTLLMVTHNLAQARRIADSVTVCWMQEGCGCVVESNACHLVFEHPSHPITAAYCAGAAG